MLVIALTGGLGAGKSTAAEYLRGRGAVVLDLDRVAEELLAPGSEALRSVAEEFGDDVLAPDGSLDRPALAQVAFASPEATRRLDELVHPLVAREVADRIAKLEASPDPPSVLVIEVPLLAEAPVFAEMADLVLAISAPPAVRLERAVAGGMPVEDAAARLAVQASDAERARFADDVIDNAGNEAALEQALEDYWERRAAHGHSDTVRPPALPPD